MLARQTIAFSGSYIDILSSFIATLCVSLPYYPISEAGATGHYCHVGPDTNPLKSFNFTLRPIIPFIPTQPSLSLCDKKRGSL